MLSHATSLLGQPYVWAAYQNTDEGKDCSGLVCNVLNNAKPGYEAKTRYDTKALKNSGFLQANKYNFNIGDVLLFKPGPNDTVGHTGIVYDIGEDGKTVSMIHSAVKGWGPGVSPGVQVTEDIWGEQTPGAYNSYWLNNYEGYIPYEKLLTKKK
jgi:cell wall-associated NlpC family hydrolase